MGRLGFVFGVFCFLIALAYGSWAYCGADRNSALLGEECEGGYVPVLDGSGMAQDEVLVESDECEVLLGAEREGAYMPFLEGKRVALFSNHTGVCGGVHTLDRLVARGVDVRAVFSPEHGFRGMADAGAAVGSCVDSLTGVPILSLYDGNSKRPTKEAMSCFDVLVVDIQDVGLRFYTYYISMYYLMDACACEGKSVVVLDRPNPNIHIVDGAILDMKYRSGVGVVPIPVFHGMTIGELALMMVGEAWLPSGEECDVRVVACENYGRSTKYELPIAPSPNLPDMRSIYMYGSMCPFEGTVLSLGRGTDFPFLVYGYPEMQGCSFSFTPRSRVGAISPPLKDKECLGVDLRSLPFEEMYNKGFDLTYIIDAYNSLDLGDDFFKPMFELLVGQSYVREMIFEGCDAKEISAMWKDDVAKFLKQRKPYLLY